MYQLVIWSDLTLDDRWTTLLPAAFVCVSVQIWPADSVIECMVAMFGQLGMLPGFTLN